MLKGIVLCGGSGSRLYPLTKVVNKHLLPVHRKPMLQHCVEKLVNADIEEIMVITGGEHLGGIAEFLGSGKDFGCRFEFRVQDEAGGIAQALSLTEGFVRDGDQMCVLLGDNIFEDELSDFAVRYLRLPENHAMVILSRVHDPERFGVASFESKVFKSGQKWPPCYLPAARFVDDAFIGGCLDGVGIRIRDVEEKPSEPKSNHAVTGIYFYDNSVFDVIRTLRPSGRGELEVTGINAHYVKTGKLAFDLFAGWWTDAGTHDSFARANELVRSTDERS